MRPARLLASALILMVLLLMGCSSGSVSNNPPSSGTSKVSLTMGDTPPAGVTILSFEITVTGAVLDPGGVSLVTTPIQVEVEHLQVETAFLNTANVPAGTYNSITVTFANPELTILNNSGGVIGTCANGAVCELTPSINSGSVTYSGAPFPLTLNANSPTGLLLDFNLNNSLQNDLSISPSVSFTQVDAAPGTGELDEIEDLTGQVTAVDAANNQFTFQDSTSGQSLTLKVDSNTVFEDFDEAGLQNSFASLAANQVVEIDAGLLSDGTLLARKVELKEGSGEQEDELEGIIVTITTNTLFTMVVVEEGRDISGIDVGNAVTVSMNSGASFQVDNDGLSVPSDLVFASAADLLVGQNVQVRRLAQSAGTNVFTDRVRLRKSRLTASVASLNGSSFNVSNLPGLFASANPPFTEIQVLTFAETEFEDVSGVGGLSVGNTVSVRGLLFKTATIPSIVADKVRKR